jgi:hypothetical protein
MATWALELDDRTLATAVDGVLQPAATGARQDNGAARCWYEFSRTHRPGPQVLDAVAADLDVRLQGATGGLRIAAPPRFEPAALGQLLGLLRRQQRDVAAFIDTAALTAAALGSQRNALVIDFGLQNLAVARVDMLPGGRGPVAQRRRVLYGERGGSLTLIDQWLDLVSEVMMRRTRFDPVHDAGNERNLRESLPAIVRQASRAGEATVRLPHAGQQYEVTLTRDQFATPAQPLYRELSRLLHELRPAGAQLNIVVPQALAELPGLAESLQIFAGCELWIIPDGFAALAASSWPGEDLDSSGVRLLRRVPVRARPQLVSSIEHRLLGVGDNAEALPTHVLYGGKALPLTDGIIEVGRDGSVRGIVLPDGLAGVSRFHCSLRREADAVFLVDYSRFGTQVNGERVAGRVRLRAGDTIRVGDPGVELNLIAVDGVRGSPAL